MSNALNHISWWKQWDLILDYYTCFSHSWNNNISMSSAGGNHHWIKHFSNSVCFNHEHVGQVSRSGEYPSWWQQQCLNTGWILQSLKTKSESQKVTDKYHVLLGDVQILSVTERPVQSLIDTVPCQVMSREVELWLIRWIDQDRPSE